MAPSQDMTAAEQDGFDTMKAYLAYCADKAPEDHDYMSAVVPHMTVVSVSLATGLPRVIFGFTVQPLHCNALGNLHGGCTATIFDYCTTLPVMLISYEGFWQQLGVSRTLNTTYLRPVPNGSYIEIDCEILQIGKRMSTLRGTMRSVTDDGKPGALLAVCEHGKANIDPPPKL